MCQLGMISQERLKVEVKLLLSDANKKSYEPRRLAQQRMTLSDLEWPFHASRAISANLLVLLVWLQVTVADSRLQVGNQPAWQCVDFSAQQRYVPRSAAGTTRRPVAMLFEQAGCRPRLACLEISRRSDAVIQYRVGRQLTWPVTSQTPSADLVCSDDMFSGQTAAYSPHSVQHRSLVNREKYAASAVACDIDAWYHFNGSNSRGQPLEGYVDACGSDVTTFRYATRMTSPTRGGDNRVTSHEVTSYEVHRCLATFTERSSVAEFTYVITEGPVSNPSDLPRFFCWLLEKSAWQANPRLYLTYSADCHIETGIEIGYQSYTGYIAQFELISSEIDREWIRNCSSRHQMPIITPGLEAMITRAGTTTKLQTDSGPRVHAVLANTAAATAVALVISSLI